MARDWLISSATRSDQVDAGRRATVVVDVAGRLSRAPPYARAAADYPAMTPPPRPSARRPERDSMRSRLGST